MVFNEQAALASDAELRELPLGQIISGMLMVHVLLVSSVQKKLGSECRALAESY